MRVDPFRQPTAVHGLAYDILNASYGDTFLSASFTGRDEVIAWPLSAEVMNEGLAQVITVRQHAGYAPFRGSDSEGTLLAVEVSQP